MAVRKMIIGGLAAEAMGSDRHAATTRSKREGAAMTCPACGRALRELQVVNGYRLTRRQREIVELAVSGLTNKAIARRLGTSVRTVEGHLYRAHKLMEED